MTAGRAIFHLQFRRAVAATVILCGGCAHGSAAPDVIAAESFDDGLAHWVVEADASADIAARDGALDIKTPKGATIWFRRPFTAPVTFDFVATLMTDGDRYDRVSDMNMFWMASDPRTSDFFADGPKRAGVFARYQPLTLYYVGYGGHKNTRTRFRRYIGTPGEPPLLPEHDLTDPAMMNVPGKPQQVRIVSEGERQRLWVDGRLIFDVRDAAPYRAGYFGFRTTQTHMRIDDFRVRRGAIAERPGQ